MTTMVSDQRALGPERCPTYLTLIILPAAVSDHVSFKDAGLEQGERNYW